MRPIRSLSWYFMIITILIFSIVILDQVTKILANSYLNGSASVSVIPGILSFHYHENEGAAWGMLADQRWVFMSISSLAIIGIIAYLIYTSKSNHSPLFRTALAFFAGGGIGNMIDRIFLGYVIDFLQFDFIDFPIFNVADSFITVGAGLMILYLILDSISEIRRKHNG